MTENKRSHLRLVYSRSDDAPEPDIFDFDGEFIASHLNLDDYPAIPLDPEPEAKRDDR